MIVILHNVRSLHNVGSIFRTADAVGIEKIYLCGITPEPVDKFGRLRQQLAKVSLGAEKSVPWEKVVGTTRLIDRLKKDKWKIIAIEQNKRSIPYFKIKAKDLEPKTALILGNEVSGLSQSVLERADKILEIPMKGKKESLNVSVTLV
jgi:23S rRNA (guanosine2251-2'-O)-methyltransferase